ncbi:MAG: hypothetical protein S4CHLAM123_00730 [Chlamydiales bacterium]|nr:hypothetical protein [Chlamydiales bacterium]
MISKIFNYFISKPYKTSSTSPPHLLPKYSTTAPKIILGSKSNITDKLSYFKKILEHGKGLDINAEKTRIVQSLFSQSLEHLAIYDIHAKLLLKRSTQQHPELETEKTLPALELMAFVVALKHHSDEVIWNSDIKPKSINQIYFNEMERAFLNLIDWNVHAEDIQKIKI